MITSLSELRSTGQSYLEVHRRLKRLIPHSERGNVEFIEVIIYLGVGLFVLAALAGGAIGAIETTDQTGWSANATAIWPVISVVAIAAIVLVILGVATKNLHKSG